MYPYINIYDGIFLWNNVLIFWSFTNIEGIISKYIMFIKRYKVYIKRFL